MVYNYENFPDELKNLPNWVARCGKMPIDPRTLYGAKASDPKTWGTFEQAAACVGKSATLKNNGTKKYVKTPIDGLGFELNAPYCGIDIDHCISPETGEISPQAAEIVRIMNSYTEISPSGTGLHILYKNDGNEHSERRKKRQIDENQAIEMYQIGRYFTVTGNVFGGHNALEYRSDEADKVYQKYLCKSAAPLMQQYKSPSGGNSFVEGTRAKSPSGGGTARSAKGGGNH